MCDSASRRSASSARRNACKVTDDGKEGGRERLLSLMFGLWAQVRSESERRRLYTEIEHLSDLVDSYRRGGMHTRR